MPRILAAVLAAIVLAALPAAAAPGIAAASDLKFALDEIARAWLPISLNYTPAGEGNRDRVQLSFSTHF